MNSLLNAMQKRFSRFDKLVTCLINLKESLTADVDRFKIISLNCRTRTVPEMVFRMGIGVVQE